MYTFLELIKNPRCTLLKKPFAHGTPEVERAFEHVQYILRFFQQQLQQPAQSAAGAPPAGR